VKIFVFSLLIFLTFSIGNSAFAEIYTDEDALDEEGKNFLIELIISTMEYIFNLVFELTGESTLQHWSDRAIDNMAKRTVDTIISQQGYVP